MTSMRDQLSGTYDRHYRRLNESVGMTPRLARHWELTLAPVTAMLRDGARVLDLGCGMGVFLSWLATRSGLRLHGVDDAPGQCDAARAAVPGAEIACAEGLSYLQRGARFDAIFCFDVLEHVPTAEDALGRWMQAIRDALAPDGWFVCRVPNAANLTGTYSRYIDITHERAFTTMSLLQLFDACGFADGRILPSRAGHTTGRVRLGAEYLLHRAVFLVCGRGAERVFTKDIYGAARRATMP